MKRILTTLSFCLALSVAAFAQGGQAKPDAMPTAEQLFEKHAQAVGGKAAIQKHNSRVAKGTFNIPAMGMSGATESYSKAPNKSMSMVTLDGIGTFLQGYDGKVAWGNDPMQGLRELSGGELAIAKRDADFYGDLKLKEAYPKATVKGKEKIGDREAYVVEATPTEGLPEKLYFDTQTGLLVRRDFTLSSPQGEIPTETYLEDYKEVDGIKVPHTIRQTNPMISFTIKVTEIKHDVPIDDAKFVKPSK